MIRRRHNSEQHNHRPKRRQYAQPNMRRVARKGIRDQGRHTEVFRGHSGDGELEFVIGPDALVTAVGGMQDVDEALGAG